MADDNVEIPADANEAQLLQDIYTETQGPRKSVYLTFAQAEDLLRHHHLLPPQGRLSRLVYIKRGFNNRVYLATSSDGTEYVIRLGGRFWDHRKIINEAGALHMARQALGDLVQIPRFLATSVVSDGSSLSNAKPSLAGAIKGTGHEEKETREDSCGAPERCVFPPHYVIMDRLPGVPLDTVWADMSLEDKKVVVDQVVEIFARLQSIPLDMIGNFVENFKEEEEKDGMGDDRPRFKVGPLMEATEALGGPFRSWEAFVASHLRQEIQHMLSEGEKFAVLRQRLPRLEALIAKIESGQLAAQFSNQHGCTNSHTSLQEQTSSSQKQENSIRFMHGDFEARNILVVGTRLTGLHDFEFSGAYPVEQEWGQSFEWLFARADDPFDPSTQETLRNMARDERELRDYFYSALKQRHGLQPITALATGKAGDYVDGDAVGSDHLLEYKVVLYHLRVNVAPWWLRDTAKLTEKQTESLMEAARSLDRALTFLGC